MSNDKWVIDLIQNLPAIPDSDDSWKEAIFAEARKTIVVFQSIDREGSTFSLSPEARRILEQRFGNDIRFSPRIFIAHEPGDDSRLRGSLAKYLVALFTGLDEENLIEINVMFLDPVTNRQR